MAENKISSVCVFCGSSLGSSEAYKQAALNLANCLAKNNCDLVYGGGNVGLMGVLAQEMDRLDRKILGIIPESIKKFEAVEASGVWGEERVVQSMHERKKMMAENSDAFIALPGGFGTFEELFEIVTWQQLGFHTKPIGVLNVNGYYDHLQKMVQHSVSEGFISEKKHGIIIFESDPERLLQRMKEYTVDVGSTKAALMSSSQT
uniref:Cytokinin riboside 5'-monophosphate phosphoribohydrolase n=1 Tax=Paramoeba aestuarina TaxID=180227 RepID=A0A7S4KET1_9EUKA|mmetsp:Transcript_17943/g.28075  ORF Transcript_17943/g.28075 Transcript_17943/m.28075 type:complete len:204 (+) Transcript_17943:103-714(+)|eukprot:CAMPEP_0201514890 /NCGR_PEP_ID=MMETSP0161_2-20130828/6612_1 /ASSEMBLY_ACC=CAM_ASM_000251 /TAXON_ID=180227 /ORGANISM="Neoparamoeba aestuarina, Strain SoJaBio B1-5/56/2" /LENGTH=203 /DNA_ID=CAMNT_0047911577 /DNA_START=39 /DNA_END=650 /DNA_ORIENTATION=+